MDAFYWALKFLKVAEKGYVNDPDNPGGPTKYGIATNYALKEAKEKGIVPKDLDVKDLTWEQAVKIYKELYWGPIKGDEIAKIDSKLAIAIFDFYVNAGGEAIKILQSIVGSKSDGIIGPKTIDAIKSYINTYGEKALLEGYLQARKDYYISLNRKKYEKGWINRVEDLKKFLNSIDSLGYAERVRSNLAEATRRIDPLVIDLDGDGIELTDIKESKAMFDLSGSGFANLVGWVNFGYNFAQRRVLV